MARTKRSGAAKKDAASHRTTKELAKEERMEILGISCFYHDSAACLVQDGHIRAAAQGIKPWLVSTAVCSLRP